MAQTVSELTPDEFGDLIKKAIKAAMLEVHREVDERAKKADAFRERLLKG